MNMPFSSHGQILIGLPPHCDTRALPSQLSAHNGRS